jgi:peroxiredoxin
VCPSALQLPGDIKLNYFDKENNMQEISIEELMAFGVSAQVVLLAVPGAFTPTCSLKHLPGFVEKYDELKAKGVDTVACVGVNDAFVMEAWGKSIDVGDKILLLADGSAIFTKVTFHHHACPTIVHAQARLGACHSALAGGRCC